jgi:hypothetical protein
MNEELAEEQRQLRKINGSGGGGHHRHQRSGSSSSTSTLTTVHSSSGSVGGGSSGNAARYLSRLESSLQLAEVSMHCGTQQYAQYELVCFYCQTFYCGAGTHTPILLYCCDCNRAAALKRGAYKFMCCATTVVVQWYAILRSRSQ